MYGVWRAKVLWGEVMKPSVAAIFQSMKKQTKALITISITAYQLGCLSQIATRDLRVAISGILLGVAVAVLCVPTDSQST